MEKTTEQKKDIEKLIEMGAKGKFDVGFCEHCGKNTIHNKIDNSSWNCINHNCVERRKEEKAKKELKEMQRSERLRIKKKYKKRCQNE